MPFDDARNRNAKAFRYNTRRFARDNSGNSTLAKVIGIRLGHACWPPHSSTHLESENKPKGNHF